MKTNEPKWNAHVVENWAHFLTAKKKTKTMKIYIIHQIKQHKEFYIYINLELEPCLNQEQDEALFKKRAFSFFLEVGGRY